MLSRWSDRQDEVLVLTVAIELKLRVTVVVSTRAREPQPFNRVAGRQRRVAELRFVVGRFGFPPRWRQLLARRDEGFGSTPHSRSKFEAAVHASVSATSSVIIPTSAAASSPTRRHSSLGAGA